MAAQNFVSSGAFPFEISHLFSVARFMLYGFTFVCFEPGYTEMFERGNMTSEKNGCL